MKTQSSTAALVLLAASHSAWPHVVLEQAAAPAGSSYRAVLKVGHGCDGLATTALSVRIPPGVRGAKPMPKPGWTLTVRSEPLPTPYTSHGKRIDADVAEITWAASSKESALPDAYYDEFVLRATLPVSPGALWFKIVQSCDDGGRQVRKEWTQIPKEGSATQGLPLPAALLQVEPAASAHSHD